jgi:hypothetical protein
MEVDDDAVEEFILLVAARRLMSRAARLIQRWWRSLAPAQQ